MIHDMPHPEHPAVAVTDDNRSRESTPREPLGRNAMVFDCLARRFQRATLREAAVARAESIVTPAIEGEEGKSQLRQGGRQKLRGTHVEVHRGAVKVDGGARARPSVRFVVEPGERRGWRGDGDQLCSHFDPANRQW